MRDGRVTMIEGTFDVAIDTPKYHKRGTVALTGEGGEIRALLKVSDMDDLVFSGTCEDKQFTFEGEGTFGRLGQVSYRANGEVWGNSIDVKCETSAGTITIFGTRLSNSAGDFKSSHEYMMAASRADFSDDTTMYSGLYADGG